MLQTYRQIFTPATARFSLVGLVARLPISMVGLGIVLLAEHETGSYGFAGSVSAVAVIANAVFAIPQGRLIDRLGQGRVLPVVITLWGVGLALAMGSLSWDWPTWSTYAFAMLAGASLPSVGTCVRARWSHTLADRPALLHTAFSFEAVGDEAVFIAGPVAVTLLATSVHPAAGLGTALVVGLAGTWAFALQRATEPPAHPRADRTSARPPMPWGAIAPLTLVGAALGIVFGGAEVVTVAFADEQGHQSLSGIYLAVWALGSLLAGVVSGAITWRRGPLARLRIGAIGMVVATLPLAFVPNLVVMAPVLLLSGLAISPTLIATMSLAEQVLPHARLTEGMAFIQTGLAVGLAPGAAVAGVVIDEAGASPAYLVCLVGGVLVLVGALLIRVGPRPDSVPPHEHNPEQTDRADRAELA
ncbi:MFS transporter [Nocardioides sp. QY071]|uniref:MFS transporter n=1 Tax=Nocardioides sp. QY071 TaxID=3044187 RepID=UPI00249C9E4F|nr:MFS transporter [Nocardioides sp. QY071]WGX99835.1 MFS transporter [Nocardioides sp. QY071]